jgi:hypothetical protein
MKKCMMLLVVTILFFIQGASAQQANFKTKTPEQRAAAQTSVMKIKCNLDSNQVAKVQAINLKYAEKLDPVFKSEEGKLARFRQAKALMDAKDAELKAVLTTSQYKQYLDLKAEMKALLKDKMQKN